MPDDDSQLTLVQRKLKAMGLSMAEVGTGRYLITDSRCNVAAGFVACMTLDAIESRIGQALPGGAK